MSAPLHPTANKFHVGNGADGKHYWLTPPDLLADLHARYGFTFDACPYPKPAEFDGLTMPWGSSTYVNPPFGSILHEGKKKGPTAWARWRERVAERPTHYDDRHDGPVHAAFGLTYASHLVIPRLVLQSMPVAWQEDFIALVNDLHAELGGEWEPENGYSVTAKKHNGRYAENPFSDYRHGRMLRPKCYDAGVSA